MNYLDEVIEEKKILDKPFMVDVPVMVTIWTRTELQKRQFDVIRKARPSILFLISDGGRNEDEWVKIEQNRKYIESSIEWSCTVYKNYETQNQGMYAMIEKYQQIVWHFVDRCIFLEDDILPSVSFFEFCSVLLEKYKDDERIFWINGMNYCGESPEITSDYFFSKVNHICGFATWKRVYDQSYGDLKYYEDKYILNHMKTIRKKNDLFYKEMVSYATKGVYEGHAPAIEFFFSINKYLQNQLCIVPKKNLVLNCGNEGSTHSDSLSKLPGKIRRIYQLPLYELSFPLKHPCYVFDDENYIKKTNSINLENRPILRIIRKIQRTLLILIHGDFSMLQSKLVNFFRRENEVIEK